MNRRWLAGQAQMAQHRWGAVRCPRTRLLTTSMNGGFDWVTTPGAVDWLAKIAADMASTEKDKDDSCIDHGVVDTQ